VSIAAPVRRVPIGCNRALRIPNARVPATTGATPFPEDPQMNARLALLTLLSAAALPFSAQAEGKPEIKVVVTAPHSDYVTPRQLARETGLTERQIGMLVGARTAYAEYLASFNRVEKTFREAMGPERYEDFINGRPIPLYRQYADVADDDRSLMADTSRPDEAINP
jgi:hypothetical protein